jgi:hypothetical protein
MGINEKNTRGSRAFTAILQFCAILLISLVAGTTFGIWQGFDPSGFSPRTFLEVHQGAVRGLNVLLPAMAFGSIAATIVLAFFSRRTRPALLLYVMALGLMIAAGLITRFGNQPINAQIMAWTADMMPADWTTIRDRWWSWHVTRTIITIAAEIALICAVLAHKRRTAD